MCDFKFIDFTPKEIIKIMEGDIKRHQKKYDYHIGIANYYRSKIVELETKIGKLHQKVRKEARNDQ